MVSDIVGKIHEGIELILVAGRRDPLGDHRLEMRKVLVQNIRSLSLGYIPGERFTRKKPVSISNGRGSVVIVDMVHEPFVALDEFFERSTFDLER